MSPSRPRFRVRWWWPAGILWTVGYVAFGSMLFRTPGFARAVFGRPPWSLALFLLPFLVGLAWLVVIAPILESRVSRFRDGWPARRRARVCRVFAWLPSAIFALLLVQFLIVKLAGIEDFGWFGSGYGVTLAGAVLLSVFYGRMMSHHQVRRIREAARRAQVCFNCNYSTTGLAGPRCPECGWTDDVKPLATGLPAGKASRGGPGSHKDHPDSQATNP